MYFINTRPTLHFESLISQPQFTKDQELWIKTSTINLYAQSDEPRFMFYKLGKTFGFFTKRYLSLRGNYVVYYEDQSSTEIKGFCVMENLYGGFFKCEEKYPYITYLTNFKNSIEMYFPELSEMNRLRSKISKYIIQLDFDRQYKLLQKIGEGSFSKVHLARKNENQLEYAVKVVKKTDKNNIKSKESVEVEKKCLEKIHSEYVCKMYEFYEDQSNFYFVLEYLPGRNLMSLIKQNNNFDLETKQFIIKGILTGIAKCHQEGIVHRDLKPQNIIINMSSFRPKIIDLGLSLLLDQKTELKNFKRCGTMGYIAPEVIANNADNRKRYDFKCDLFSFGIICHLLLFGVNPLKGKNYQQTFMKNKTLKFELNKALINKQYGPYAHDFLRGLLEIDSKNRFSAAEALKHQFLNVKAKETKKEELKTTVTEKEMDKLENKLNDQKMNQKEDSQYDEISIQEQKKLPNISKYCVKIGKD